MNNLKTLSLAALFVPVLIPAEKVAYGPPEGLTLTKTFTHNLELSLDNLDMLMNGEESPIVPDMEMTMNMEQTVVVTDEYQKVGDGAPTKLRRTYDELSSETDVSMQIEMMGTTQDNSSSISATSEIEGMSVIFSRGEDGEYKAAYDGEEGDEELLEGLLEDMDLRSLLPEGEVKKGDEWSIDVSKLVPVLAPGGNLSLLPDSDELDFEAMSSGFGGGSMADMMGDLLEGEAKGVFQGFRDVEGVNCLVIAITIEIDTSADLTDKIVEAMEDIDMPPEAGDFEFTHMELDLTLSAEGTLLWNPKGGHFHSLELSGDIELAVDQEMEISAQGQEMTISTSAQMAGTISIEYTTE